ncbi:hypothetical protein FRC09_018283 [Ceratobasidium sp. 395]|nr:hypothetical protein FRC09_018283 [Ceratobasidium sp. 395]
MDFGPFHDRVKAHCRAIIHSPSLLLSPVALDATGPLDSEKWDHSEVMYRVANLGSSLPHLKLALVASFEGAFDSGSTIAQAIPKQRRSAWVPPANNTSEGALGYCRQMLRRAPRVTDNQRNARVMWKRNNTHEWSQQVLTDSDAAYILREARLLEPSGDDPRDREEINAALEERATANHIRKEKADLQKSATKEKLDRVSLLGDSSYKTLCTLRVKHLDLQVDKLRDRSDLSTPAKSTIRSKEAKVTAILSAFEWEKFSITGAAGVNFCLELYAA